MAVEYELYQGAYSGSEIDANLAYVDDIKGTIKYENPVSVEWTNGRIVAEDGTIETDSGYAYSSLIDIKAGQRIVWNGTAGNTVAQLSKWIDGEYDSSLLDVATDSNLNFLIPHKFWIADEDCQLRICHRTAASETSIIIQNSDVKPTIYNDIEFFAGSPLWKKKIVAFGDSYIKGSYLGEYPVWLTWLAAKYRMTVVNNGVNGSTIAEKEGRNPIVDRYADVLAENTDADIVLVEGGTNDRGYAVPIGSVDSTDTETYCGALNTIIDGIREITPRAKIFCVSVPWRWTTVSSIGLWESDYAQAMTEVCANKSVPCHNPCFDGDIDFRDEYIATWADEGVWMGDEANKHYSPDAYQFVLPAYEKFLSQASSSMLPAVTPSDLLSYLTLESGTALESTTDIFQLPIGVYARMHTDVTVTNIPAELATAAFYAVIVNTISSIRKRIYLFPTGATLNDRFFICTETSSGYGDWKQFTADDGTLTGVVTQVNALKAVDAEVGKNLLKTLHPSLTSKNVQISLQQDGTYELSGTSSAAFTAKWIGTLADLPESAVGKTAILTGGVSSNIQLRVYNGSTRVYDDTGDGVEFTITAAMRTTPYEIRLVIGNNTNCSNVVVKPMLRVQGTAVFKPYEPSLRELYERTAAINSKALKVGAYYALGDGIVERQGSDGALEEWYSDGTLYGYIPRIETTYGMVCTNKGKAGHTLLDDILTLTAVDYSFADFVTIAYGTEDGAAGVTLGDVTDTGTSSFAGALNTLLAKIYGDNPMCKVLVLTPIQRADQDGYGSFVQDANNKTLEDFANMAKAVAERNATPCVDLFHKSGINSATFSDLLTDGVYPLNVGYERMWSVMRAALNEMLA